ncbi:MULTISPECIES: polysaccharide pyruvyl transferase family protein [unclassified Agarivorans]|uniref:polysaccharide pyruvyl transferase family protein n=1 Tax=unclassified Agarivorans TaxID=2636026 RepID=UPI003D7D7B9D
MQLFYYKDDIGNFGDDLNPWLWPKLLPDFFNDDPSELLVGIGTLLNHHLPSDKTLHIVGSGVGYGDIPQVTELWKVHAVRGPYSAKSLNLDPSCAITDSALLLRNVMQPKHQASGDIGFMPHYLSCRSADWQNIAESCGYRFISPEWSVERVFAEMQQCRLMLCEAMHGAIVADALRIPWHPVLLSDKVNTVKWKDWLDTINIDFQPTTIRPYIHYANVGTKQYLKDEFKRTVRSFGFGKDWYPPQARNSSIKSKDETIANLAALANTKRCYLSDENLQNRLLQQLNDAVEQMQYSSAEAGTYAR